MLVASRSRGAADHLQIKASNRHFLLPPASWVGHGNGPSSGQAEAGSSGVPSGEDIRIMRQP
jgi:hypothetical protein